MQYRTKQGDVLDAIAFKIYQRESAVHQILAANPGLAEYGPSLPAGLLINLPPLIDTTQINKPIRLFD